MELSYKKLLRKAVLFQDINDAGYDVLIKCLAPQIKTYTKKEIILLTGDLSSHIGIILTGTAPAYLEHINGNHTLITNLSPGRVFGEVLVSTRTHQSPVTIYASSDVTIAYIEYQKLYSICSAACEAHKTFLQNIHKAIGDKYFQLFDRVNILSEKSLRLKIFAYLYSLSDRGKKQVIKIPYSKTMLADYLLSNRSALSKELHKMQREGLITVKGREITIKNILGLIDSF